MTQTELYQVLQGSGIPFAYHHWEKPPKQLPWGVYFLEYENKFYADGTLYYHIAGYRAELYTDKKDLNAESFLDNAFNQAGISYAKTGSYINGQKLYETTYEFEV
ncbi:MAG: hypothetical protein HFJ84_08165 [Clostridiales bacterium]|jgi:hypothetical protein|nr:hypothetical protein [Clostridiales bacterium]